MWMMDITYFDIEGVLVHGTFDYYLSQVGEETIAIHICIKSHSKMGCGILFISNSC